MTTFNQYLGADLLTEAVWSGSHKTSAVLPAGRVLFNKNKVTPDHAASKEAGVWGSGPQSVRTYHDGAKHFHVSSHGHYNPESKHEKKIGETEHFHHDQTLRNMKSGKLVGVSNYTDGKKTDHHGEDHSKTAAPFHVYK